MIHLGDITKLHGDAIPPVDCITGGSPCQDLSVAGKRAGLAGERSGLFMEQIRIVKEMRERDRRTGQTAWAVRPRFMVWENVPGAFSSNGGKDFQAVLTEIVKIVEPDASDVPLPDKGKWPKAGCLYSDVGDWSVAWRVHDAQFWGVPQRRKRIALVADFGGLAAPEVLFEREGLSRDPEPRGEAREGAAAAAESGVDGAVFYDAYQHHGWRKSETSGTLTVGQNNGVRGDTPLITVLPASMGMGGGYVPMVTGGAKASGLVTKGNGEAFLTPEKHMSLGCGGGQAGQGYPAVVTTAYGISAYESNAMKSGNPHSGVYEADTARTLDLNGGSPACNQGGVAIVQESYIPDVAHALSARHDGSPQPDKGNGANIVAVHQNASGEVRENDVAYTIGTNANASGRNTPLVYDARGNGDGKTVPTMTGDHQNRVTDYTALCMDVGFFQTNVEKCGALLARQYKDPPITVGTLCAESYPGKLAHQDVQSGLFPVTNAIVRRLTPLECERLQGFPDGWTDIGEWTDTKGKRHKEADSPRYKALGNSIALPFWEYLARRICAQYERPVTIGSLFDGIGGFPLAFERCGAKAVWASEIEEFPIAVTKVHFPEETQT